MKLRTTLQAIAGLLFALMLVVCATALETSTDRGYSRDPHVWLRAHQIDPMLWLVDFGALYSLTLVGGMVSARKRLYRLGEETLTLREEYNKQLGAVVAQTSELQEINDEQAERIETLEQEAEARQESFEQEARRLTEQAFRAIQGQVEAHSRQLEAVHLALQYHRAEITQLRHHLRALNGATEPEKIARLSPAELAALSDGATPPAPEETPLFPTVNGRSTFVLTTAEYDVTPVSEEQAGPEEGLKLVSGAEPTEEAPAASGETPLRSS